MVSIQSILPLTFVRNSHILVLEDGMRDEGKKIHAPSMYQIHPIMSFSLILMITCKNGRTISILLKEKLRLNNMLEVI